MSADASSNAFHALGGMPVAETDRIDENTEKTIELGNMVCTNTLFSSQNDRDMDFYFTG